MRRKKLLNQIEQTANGNASERKRKLKSVIVSVSSQEIKCQTKFNVKDVYKIN